MKLIHTDNFNRDYPDEKFVEGLPPGLPEEAMKRIATAINNELKLFGPRFYKVVPDDYELKPGFEP